MRSLVLFLDIIYGQVISCGRIYSNISQRISAVSVLYGMDTEFVMRIIGEAFGHIPEETRVPVCPFSRLKLIKVMIPKIIKYRRKTIKTSKDIPHEIVGSEDASTLLSNFRGDSDSQSLGPVLGISKVIDGQMSKEEYLKQYGRCGPFTISIPNQWSI